MLRIDGSLLPPDVEGTVRVLMAGGSLLPPITGGGLYKY